MKEKSNLKYNKGVNIIWFDNDIEITDVTIQSDSGTASVTELSKYITNKSTLISESITEYTVKLSKVDGSWNISQLSSDDEYDQSLESVDYDLVKYTKVTDNGMGEVLATAPVPQLRSSATYVYPNDSNTKIYALTYALNYNSRFPDYVNNANGPDDVDCQNFASQAIWYGLGGTNTSTAINNKDFPMLDNGSSASDWDSWYHSGTKYDTPSTWAWTNVANFKNHTTNYDLEGISATVVSGWQNAEVGDILQVKVNSSDFDHSYVVTGVTGTAGSRTTSDVYVSAHTSDCKHNTLLERGYSSLSSSISRLIKVSYQVQQR